MCWRKSSIQENDENSSVASKQRLTTSRRNIFPSQVMNFSFNLCTYLYTSTEPTSKRSFQIQIITFTTATSAGTQAWKRCLRIKHLKPLLCPLRKLPHFANYSSLNRWKFLPRWSTENESSILSIRFISIAMLGNDAFYKRNHRLYSNSAHPFDMRRKLFFFQSCPHCSREAGWNSVGATWIELPKLS